MEDGSERDGCKRGKGRGGEENQTYLKPNIETNKQECNKIKLSNYLIF
jgi:hypothetical protein